MSTNTPPTPQLKNSNVVRRILVIAAGCVLCAVAIFIGMYFILVNKYRPDPDPNPTPPTPTPTPTPPTPPPPPPPPPPTPHTGADIYYGDLVQLILPVKSLQVSSTAHPQWSKNNIAPVADRLHGSGALTFQLVHPTDPTSTAAVNVSADTPFRIYVPSTHMFISTGMPDTHPYVFVPSMSPIVSTTTSFYLSDKMSPDPTVRGDQAHTNQSYYLIPTNYTDTGCSTSTRDDHVQTHFRCIASKPGVLFQFRRP
jgi:hypothetical protein